MGRERLGPHQPAWPLLPPLGFGFVAWLGARLIYGMWKATQTGGCATSADFISNLTARDFAFLATVPPLAGFAALWTLDAAIGGVELLRQIGFTLRHLGTGVARGLIAALIILPPTYIFSIGIDALYTRFHYIHPTEHQLLKAMSDTQNPGMPLDTHPGGGSRRSVVRRIPVPRPHSNTHPARLGSRCNYVRQARDQFPWQYSDFCIAIDGSID